CVSSCGDDQNYHTVIEGVRSTTQFKYLDANLAELAAPQTLGEIIYVELKLDLVFLEETTSYSTIVYPEKTQL
ncbi:MAG: hypothetical protein QGH17_08845, partial [Candidatus Marinimicrobia bacterium]|nr:hypothetical protein [Candidatus Neomarinimicrobiota bacterium]